MPGGFGQSYWVQVAYQDDRDDLWVPVNGSETTACDAAALWLSQEGVDFVYVLDGKVPRHTLPSRRQVLHSFERLGTAEAEGAKVYRIQTKKAKQRLRG